MTGMVKWFNSGKGYGFIIYKDSEDIFFHYSSIKKEGYKTISANKEVEFQIKSTSKGLQAIEVIEL